jgi:hypothetical protein
MIEPQEASFVDTCVAETVSAAQEATLAEATLAATLAEASYTDTCGGGPLARKRDRFYTPFPGCRVSVVRFGTSAQHGAQARYEVIRGHTDVKDTVKVHAWAEAFASVTWQLGGRAGRRHGAPRRPPPRAALLGVRAGAGHIAADGDQDLLDVRAAGGGLMLLRTELLNDRVALRWRTLALPGGR